MQVLSPTDMTTWNTTKLSDKYAKKNMTMWPCSGWLSWGRELKKRNVYELGKLFSYTRKAGEILCWYILFPLFYCVLGAERIFHHVDWIRDVYEFSVKLCYVEEERLVTGEFDWDLKDQNSQCPLEVHVPVIRHWVIRPGMRDERILKLKF